MRVETLGCLLTTWVCTVQDSYKSLPWFMLLLNQNVAKQNTILQ